MRLIHCADLHLDSKLNANLDKKQAWERRNEILHTFERMVEYAREQKVEAILIAGDLFDTKNISATAKNTVCHCIMENKDIRFYYLKGNHDTDFFLEGLDAIPDNLRLFGTEWKQYEEEDGAVTISGIELCKENNGSAPLSLVLDSAKFNIVLLHGQESEGDRTDKGEIINLKAFRNKGIDYLALGHIHAYKKERLDVRGEYCYPGCLEGRGFDECGKHGFVLMEVDVNTNTYTHEWIPFAYRTLYTVFVDVTGCLTTAEMVGKIESQLDEEGILNDSLVKIVLTGAVDVECEKNLEYLSMRFKNRYYCVKICDETTWKVDVEEYMQDMSLKGEFVRQVMEDDSLGEEDRKEIIRYGLQAIAGEEVQ